jgi:pantoate--beta-alanine ligase
VAHVIVDPAAMRAWASGLRTQGRSIALVPTMGALHRGHLELIRTARGRADAVVASIFVNPLQFGESADFEHYPRPIDDDLQACDDAGVDAVYAPTAAAMYPDGFASTVHVSGLSERMEGASRPGHFDGVTTVVTKLFAAVRPDLAVFGEKDFQQLAVVRRMASDLDLGVEIVAQPTVREPDGLALSSRNRRLSEVQRRAAVCIPEAIRAAIEQAGSGSDAGQVVEAARAVIDGEPLAGLDYVAVFDATSLCPVTSFDDHHRRPGRVRIAVAARFGDIRLIDNAELFPRRP